jgi:heptosyltransferase III
MPGRILIIRGGAIGDFILTLPAIGLIRQNLPDVRIEILGYPSVLPLALSSDYADAVHSIEYAPLARFFSRKADLDPAMVAFFAGFQQIVSYLYDPDGIFENNLRAAGVKNLLIGNGKLNDHAHAVDQLARPLEQLAFFLEDRAPHFWPTEKDRADAARYLAKNQPPFVAMHIGSGSQRKNWPLENWEILIKHLQANEQPVLLIGGEADRETLSVLQAKTGAATVENLPLRTLGAVLSQARLFIGHDSGISHLAAATGIRCLLLFGPTDPEIWAPLNPQVEMIVSPDGQMTSIDPRDILRFLPCGNFE